MALFFLIFLIAQNGTDVVASTDAADAPPPPPMAGKVGQFKPGIAVIVAILTTIFSLTFLLLMYMKHCKRGDYSYGSGGGGGYYYYPTAAAAGGRSSGVDRKVVGSLPMFRFSSLTGQKDGLECAVCLNRFEPAEVLRLLPKCKHAFHVECVDTWLDAHSTCPLCRYRVDPEDVLLLVDPCCDADRATPRSSGNRKERPNPRISGRHSSAGERGTSLGIIVENPGHDFRGRVSLDSWHSRRKSGNPNSENQGGGKDQHVAENQGRRSKAACRKDGQLPVQRDSHRLEHRIIVSAAEAAGEERRRWSDAQAAEFLYLRSEEMMIVGKGECHNDGRGVINGRSVSEMTGVSRYGGNNNNINKNISSIKKNNNNGEREGAVVRRWLDWISQSQTTAGHTVTASAPAPSMVV